MHETHSVHSLKFRADTFKSTSRKDVVVFSRMASRGSCGSVYLGLFQSVAADSGPPQPVVEKGLFTARGPKRRERCDI